MIKYQMFIAVALLVGVAIGYFVKDEPVAAAEPAKVEDKAKKPVADKGDEATVRALRHRIAELEKALAEKEERSEAAVASTEPQARAPERPQMNWRERIEEMKKNDPERYSEMTNRMAQWRRDQSVRAKNKIEFLSSIDTSRMSAGAKKTHIALQNLIARRDDLEAQLQQECLSDDDRGTLMRELWESHRELQRLNAEERKILIDETAKGLGFAGEDAREFSETIQEVIEATDSGWGGRHHGGPRGGGPHGPGGPGGR